MLGDKEEILLKFLTITLFKIFFLIVESQVTESIGKDQ